MFSQSKIVICKDIHSNILLFHKRTKLYCSFSTLYISCHHSNNIAETVLHHFEDPVQSIDNRYAVYR